MSAQLADALHLCAPDTAAVAPAAAAAAPVSFAVAAASIALRREAPLAPAAAAAAVVVGSLQVAAGRARPGHVRSLADALEGNCRVRSLSLAHNPHVMEAAAAGGAGVFAVCRLLEALETNTRLTRLDLAGCQVSHFPAIASFNPEDVARGVRTRMRKQHGAFAIALLLAASTAQR